MGSPEAISSLQEDKGKWGEGPGKDSWKLDSASWSLPGTSRQYKDLALGLGGLCRVGGGVPPGAVYESLMHGHVTLGPVFKTVTPEELHILQNPPVSS